MLITTLLSFIMVSVAFTETKKHNVIPENGIVPTKEVAIKIAVAVWVPIYGKEQIEKQKPYRATLENGVWTVKGTLNQPKQDPKNPGIRIMRVGGVALAEISKLDGRIIRISHSR